MWLEHVYGYAGMLDESTPILQSNLFFTCNTGGCACSGRAAAAGRAHATYAAACCAACRAGRQMEGGLATA
jgi:hypothetical protein